MNRARWTDVTVTIHGFDADHNRKLYSISELKDRTPTQLLVTARDESGQEMSVYLNASEEHLNTVKIGDDILIKCFYYAKD